MFDKVLWDYHQDNNRSHLKMWYNRQKMIFKFVKKYIEKWSRILELWFWDGYLLYMLSWYGYITLWQDISKLNIKTTKKQWNLNTEFILWDESWKIYIDNNSLDCFIASEVLEHMTDIELAISIKEIYRVLKVWWYAIITFPAKEYLKNNECICPKCWEIFHKWWHKQYWDEKKIKNIFKDFNIIYLKSIVIGNSCLNIFGKIEFFAKYMLNYLTKHLDWNTYILILRK